MSVSPSTTPASPEAAKPVTTPATPTPRPTAPATRPSARPATALRPAAARPTAAKPTAAVPPVAAAPVAARPTPPRPAVAVTAPPAPARPVAPAKPASPWADLFGNWPAGIPKRGIVVSQQGEATSFRGFMLRGEMVLLERLSPDSLGARFLLLPFEEVAGVKFTDPLKQEIFEAAGFTGKLSS